MDKKKKIIIAVGAILIVLIGIVVVVRLGGKEKIDENTEVIEESATKKNDDAVENAEDENVNVSDANDYGESKNEPKKSDSEANNKEEKNKASEAAGKSADNAEDEQTDSEKLAEYTKNLPTFIYFCSSEDATYAEDKKNSEKLQKEYEGRVTFMIKDIDGSEGTYEELMGAMETPALIMLDKDGNSSAIIPAATGYDLLKGEIEKTLN